MRGKRESYKGVHIVEVTVPRFEARHVDGRKVRSFATKSAAKVWVDGFLKGLGLNSLHRKEGNP